MTGSCDVLELVRAVSAETGTNMTEPVNSQDMVGLITNLQFFKMRENNI